MPFLITNVYHQWNTCNSYSCAKKSYGHQTTLFVGISGGTNISTVDHDELNIFLSHPFTTSVARLHRVTTYLWTRNRCQQPRTSASTRNEVIPSVDASKVWLQLKIYRLDRGSVRRINCPVNMIKMAAGHLPTSSHNFAWRGVINHDRTTKLTLQNKYDHTMPAGYPKVASPLEISFWIRNLFTHGQTLPGRFAIDSEAIDRRVDVVYRDVITGSRESRDHHYDARLIHRILKSLLPQNNTFFIATASVVKDAADNPDCQGLREQWYYLLFYVRRTMPPTVSPVNSPNKGQKALMLSLICDWTNV